MKRVLLAVPVVLLVLAAPAVARIVVGKGIDTVRIGDSLGSVKRKLGHPQESRRNPAGGSRLNYTTRKLVVTVDPRRGVIELDTFNTHERTAKGVGPGSTFAAVRKAYPGACSAGVPVCAINDGTVLTQFAAPAPGARRVQVVKVQYLPYG